MLVLVPQQVVEWRQQENQLWASSDVRKSGAPDGMEYLISIFSVFLFKHNVRKTFPYTSGHPVKFYSPKHFRCTCGTNIINKLFDEQRPFCTANSL
jgi:hypothetical protein